MRRFRRLAGSATVLMSGVAILVPTAVGATASAEGVTAAAGAPTVIGVDAAPPAGKSWEYTHYFPESGVQVPQGGLVLFQWDQGSPDGLHSVTFVPAGSTEAKERQTRPTLVQEAETGESDTIVAPLSFFATSATCSTGPTAPPCTFDGTSVVSSGVIPNPTGAAFAVSIAPTTAPGTYTYFCVIHPGMKGTLDVVPAGQAGTPAATVASMAASEYHALTAGALQAEAAASVPTSTTNLDGSRTWTMHVGLTADDVELLEYLPLSLPIRKGDSVKFDGTGTTQEPHTVTSPGGANSGFFAIGDGQCETASGPDTPAAQVNGPPQTGCADPTGFEQPVDFHTKGVANLITSQSTPVGAVVSGRADVFAAGGEPSHSYTFGANGTYVFFCTLHENMFGVVSTPGYRLASSNGGVFTFGAADFFGSKGASPPASPIVAAPATFDNQGYWLVTADGHTYNFGDAGNVGNTPVRPAAPIVGATATDDNGGLLLVAKDGGVFALGSAPFLGSMGGKRLNAPIVGIDAGFSSSGYDLVAADGGVFNFGTTPNGSPRYFGGK